MESTSARRRERVAFLALVITVVLAVTKLLVWVSTSSLAVLSQTVDSAIDIVALLLLWLGVRIAARPADETHHYGHAKAENLVAFVETLILGALAGGIAWEAIGRLATEEASQVNAPWYAFGLLVGSAVVDALRVRLLLETARSERSDALRSGALNFSTDLGTAAVALISLLFVRAGLEQADAVGAIVVALAAGIAACRLGKRSVDVLMDRAPAAPVDEIAAAATAAPGVAETRRVRVRGSEQQLFADVTVAAGRTASLERAHDIAEGVEREIERVAPGADVVVHVEPSSEVSGLAERVLAAASRLDGVSEVHNVLVHAFDERGHPKLHVTLHAKARPGMSVQDAHALSDEIELAVAKELQADVRVDTHIEPLEPTALGRDVTETRQDIVASVKRLALHEPDVVDCHEVVVTASNGDLSVVAHVRGRRELALARLHLASHRIENAIRAANPEVHAVLIHFEPA